jgi:hypothetical protein
VDRGLIRPPTPGRERRPRLVWGRTCRTRAGAVVGGDPAQTLPHARYAAPPGGRALLGPQLASSASPTAPCGPAPKAPRPLPPRLSPSAHHVPASRRRAATAGAVGSRPRSAAPPAVAALSTEVQAPQPPTPGCRRRSGRPAVAPRTHGPTPGAGEGAPPARHGSCPTETPSCGCCPRPRGARGHGPATALAGPRCQRCGPRAAGWVAPRAARRALPTGAGPGARSWRSAAGNRAAPMACAGRGDEALGSRPVTTAACGVVRCGPGPRRMGSVWAGGCTIGPP